MFKRNLFIAILICCLAVTSCMGFAPQTFAAESTAGSIQESDGQDGTESDDGDQEPDSPSVPEESEDPAVPEESEPVINAWDENGFYHGADGEIVTGQILTVGNKVYRFDANGLPALYTGALKAADGKSYYYKNGQKYTGIRLISGKPYYYKNGLNSSTVTYLYNKKYYKNGKVYTGVYKSYYYNKGVKVTKYKNKVQKASNGKFYYFQKKSSVYTGTGWKRINGKRYYFKNGVAYTGWHYIGNYKYYFHKSNASLCQDLISCLGSKWKKKDLMITVNRKKNVVTIYAKDGKKGYTIPVKALTCSVGKKKSPTIKGTYTMKAGSGKTYRWHVLGGPALGFEYSYAQYCVRIHKSWLFHSVPYSKPNKMKLQAKEYNKLGQAASHGCIRLRVKDAKLIYDIVKYRNTKVKIYDSSWTGPFDKPVIKKISTKQKYDPTDPSVKKK